MDRLFKPYDKEYMRMAMLKHEETFKQQVHELHRLYQIQKILMKTIETDHGKGNGSDQNIGRNEKKAKSVELDLERPAGDYIAESMDESEVDLTLGLGLSHNPRKIAERSALNSDSGPSSFSSSSTGSSRIINRQSYGVAQLEVEGEHLTPHEKLSLSQPPWLVQVLSFNMT